MVSGFFWQANKNVWLDKNQKLAAKLIKLFIAEVVSLEKGKKIFDIIGPFLWQYLHQFCLKSVPFTKPTIILDVDSFLDGSQDVAGLPPRKIQKKRVGFLGPNQLGGSSHDGRIRGE